MGSLLWLGILLAILASMVGTAGKQLLRFAQLQSQRGTKLAHCLSKASMTCGFMLNVLIGPLVDMGSYAFAPQSVIAPLGGLDVVWNTMSAPCTLGEKLTPSLVFGCALIACGATGTSFFGSKEEKPFTPERVKETLFRWTVLVYIIVLLAWVIFNVVILMSRSAAPKGQPFVTGDKLRGLSLGMTAGSIAGNMFCVKAFVEIIQASIQERKLEYLLDWLPYTLFVGALFFATSNLYFLVKALCEYEALFMGAVFEGSLIIASCVSGSVVFSELEGLEVWQICVYWLAVLGILTGVFTVAVGCMASAAPAVDQDCSTTGQQPGTMVPSTPATEPSQLDQTQVSSKSVDRSPSKRSNLSDNPFRDVPLIVKEMKEVKQRAEQDRVGSNPRLSSARIAEPAVMAW